MAGKRLGKRDKEGVTVPLHVNDPVGPHTHPMTPAVRLAKSYTALRRNPRMEKTPPLKLGSQELGHT